jgi:hypothetical protein
MLKRPSPPKSSASAKTAVQQDPEERERAYSITSSVRASKVVGMVKPSALAVLTHFPHVAHPIWREFLLTAAA